MELLERWCPRLRYDSQAVFFAISPAAMTDAPGNRVTRGKRTVASADGVPLLSREWLRDYEQRDKATRFGRRETIRQGADRLGVARQLQSHPRYADRVHGRVLERDGTVYLQYWLYFYATPRAVDGSRDQPAWRLAQVELSGGKPVRLVVRNATGGYTDEVNRVAASRPHDGDEPRELFVSPLTHNLYFEPGDAKPGYVWDRADGGGRLVAPAVERFDGWERWPGTWGAGVGGRRSPAFDGAW